MINNIISQGTSIFGEINLDGSLRIDGQVEGVIFNRGSVYISNSGTIKADVHTEEMIIGGKMIGSVYAKKSVKLLKSANLVGNIYTKTISAEEGSIFKGDCEIV